MPIARAFTELADRDPDAVAVRCDGTVLTRAGLESQANRLARQWAASGVGQDDLVTVSLLNGVDFVLACVAAWKLGATPQPLSPRLGHDERSAVLELARPALVVDHPVVVDTSLDDSPLPDAVASSWKAPTSSGSTGRPKIVLASAPSTVDPDGRVAPFVPRDAVQLVAGPLFHAAPFVYAMRGLMTGHELVLMPRFDPEQWLALVARHHVTWGMLVPTTMQRITRLGDDVRSGYDVSSLASVLHMGARCPEWLKRDWIDWLGPERVVEVYAGTESAGLTMIDGAEWLEHPGSVGRPVPGSRFRVVRPDGQDCAPDEVGEVLMQRDGGETYAYRGADAVVRDGWHTLGDAGWLDADGYLFVADRLDDVVVTGGVKVQPADVEAVLDAHPSVRASVVVPRPDDDLGHRVHAVVETSGVDESDLRAWVAERLDPEKRPRSYELVTETLRDDTGKARRHRWR